MKYTAHMDVMWQRDGRKVYHELTVSGETIFDVGCNIDHYLRFVLQPEIIPPEIFNAPNRNGYSGTDKGQGRYEIWYIPGIKLYCHKRVLGMYRYVNHNFSRDRDWPNNPEEIYKIKNKQQIFRGYEEDKTDCE